jgi:hypothetical protein
LSKLNEQLLPWNKVAQKFRAESVIYKKIYPKKTITQRRKITQSGHPVGVGDEFDDLPTKTTNRLCLDLAADRQF